MKNITIYQYIKLLSAKSKKLLEHYIKYEYVSGIRTGKGKRKNFFEEHNSPEGIRVVKEILKFKRLEEKVKMAEKKLKNNKNK